MSDKEQLARTLSLLKQAEAKKRRLDEINIEAKRLVADIDELMLQAKQPEPHT